MHEKVASLVSLTTAFCRTSVKTISDVLRSEHLGWVQTHPQAVLLHFFQWKSAVSRVLTCTDALWNLWGEHRKSWKRCSWNYFAFFLPFNSVTVIWGMVLKRRKYREVCSLHLSSGKYKPLGRTWSMETICYGFSWTLLILKISLHFLFMHSPLWIWIGF